MLSITQASTALKDYYLGVITNQLNTKVNPLLSRIKQNTESVTGKDVVKLVSFGINGGIGAGEETGNLPSAAENRYLRLTFPLRNLYGRIEISDKIVRASQSSSGAFVNMLNAEMEGLLDAASLNLSRMLYGDGTGVLATVASANASAKTITVNSVKRIVEGMVVQVLSTASGAAVIQSSLRVKSVDRAANSFTVDETFTGVAADQVVAVASGFKAELGGLEAILGSSSVIYGQPRSQYGFLKPNVDSTTTEVTETAIQSAVDGIEEGTGDPINFIACSYGVKRALQNHLATYRRNIDTMNLAGGFRAISYNGIPVVADRFCADKTMYLLNTDYFTLCQLCDWEWLEGENGTVLKQIAGTATYSATLVKYAELFCDKIRAQAVFTNLTEA